MKKIGFLLALVVGLTIFSAGELMAQDQEKPKTNFWIEEQVLLTEEDTLPQIDGLLSHQLSEKLGIFGWFQVSEGYSQTYLGPTYSPAPWLQFGAGLGMETGEDPLRFGGFVFAGNEDVSLLTVYESSEAGYWYKAELNFPVTEELGLGAMVQRFVGVGPRFELNIPDTPVKLWCAPLYDWETEDRSVLLGIRLSF